jgi:hypothetical protein
LNGLLKNEQLLKQYKDPSDKYWVHCNLPPELLSFSKDTKSFTITLKITDTRFNTEKGKKISRIDNIDLSYLIKIK